MKLNKDKKFKKNIWYLGYVVSIILVIILFVLELSKPIQILVTMSFTCIFSITFIMTTHNSRIIKDKKYSAEYNDERNTFIREKTNATMAPIFILLFGIQAIYAIAYDLYKIAIFNGLVVILSPILMIIISKYYEKKN